MLFILSSFNRPVVVAERQGVINLFGGEGLS
jgi:hypothetical protein